MAPLWLGGNRLLAWGRARCVLRAILIILELTCVLSRRGHRVDLNYLRVPAILMAAAIIWIVLQTLDIVPGSWKHPIWSLGSHVLGEDLPGSISVDRELTMLALIRLLTAIAVFWVSLQLCREARRASRLLLDLAIIGFVYSTYGIFSLALAPDSILWLEEDIVCRIRYSDLRQPQLVRVVCGRHAARRHWRHGAAGSARTESTTGGWRLMLASAIRVTGKQGVFLLVMIFTISMALLLSGSRGGITSTALGLFVLITLYTARREHQRAAQIGTILTACAIILTAFLAYGDVFVGRLDTVAQDAGGRLAAFRIVAVSIGDAPILGFGYGTFQDVFPMYRDGSVGLWGVWDKAHNSYLELFQGLGLVFGAAFLASIGILVWRCVQASVLRHQSARFRSSPLRQLCCLVCTLSSTSVCRFNPSR